jgi:hypothetical protein
MKNIHIIPTDKPKWLWTNNLRRRLELDEFPSQHSTNITKNIYITSDEKPKKGDWVFNETSKEVYKITNVDELVIYEKKIILTADFRLAPDVQKVDDEFLEWFVKNPSCEWVDVKYQSWKEINDVGKYTYKIIIPQEEEPKQESLEEFIKEVLEGVFFSNNAEYRKAERLIELGAKWQSKRMYSEEEVKHIVSEALQSALVNVDLEQWFENNKKK